MRAVVQRVRWAKVRVGKEIVGAIDRGMLVLLGVGQDDSPEDADALAKKIVGLRIFEDPGQRMNLALGDVSGALLVVSQFTIYGDCRKGRRPSFMGAMEPVGAEALCRRFVGACEAEGAAVHTGRFRTMMMVELCNDGPVTLLLDSRKQF